MRISDWSSDVCSSDLLSGLADLKPSRSARSRNFPAVYSRNIGRRCLAIMTFENSQQIDLLPMDLPTLMSSRAASPARTSASRDAASDFPEIGRASCRERVCQYV